MRRPSVGDVCRRQRADTAPEGFGLPGGVSVTDGPGEPKSPVVDTSRDETSASRSERRASGEKRGVLYKESKAKSEPQMGSLQTADHDIVQLSVKVN